MSEIIKIIFKVTTGIILREIRFENYENLLKQQREHGQRSKIEVHCCPKLLVSPKFHYENEITLESIFCILCLSNKSEVSKFHFFYDVSLKQVSTLKQADAQDAALEIK